MTAGRRGALRRGDLIVERAHDETPRPAVTTTATLRPTTLLKTNPRRSLLQILHRDLGAGHFLPLEAVLRHLPPSRTSLVIHPRSQRRRWTVRRWVRPGTPARTRIRRRLAMLLLPPAVLPSPAPALLLLLRRLRIAIQSTLIASARSTHLPTTPRGRTQPVLHLLCRRLLRQGRATPHRRTRRQGPRRPPVARRLALATFPPAAAAPAAIP